MQIIIIVTLKETLYQLVYYSRTSLVRTLLMSNTWLRSTIKDRILQLIYNP